MRSKDNEILEIHASLKRNGKIFPTFNKEKNCLDILLCIAEGGFSAIFKADKKHAF